ncbi:hypothetical protein SPBR_07334 [Sporothrix brasiliensis 5110]|uniref:AB hydrolase-1 domain-containing protein n=1 Tax=Sporothrix brasiliensis 5110 TaxID=1398154 RepID=A0A0C2IUJ3_9PEZI|nr:uncharacterized protein SPBR_07334 [Sporothrix brasiliensis 5110]KIH88632.1 hypothetical protein SPBR_07334 [Sporothrix brasiliensis 5110]
MAARAPVWGSRLAHRSIQVSSLQWTSRKPGQRHVLGSLQAAHAPYSSKSVGSDDGPVKLAFDLHKPEKPVADDKTRPILVLHGLFGSKKNNRSISKVLARDLGRSIYALDMRNHGDSPHVARHDYEVMADDVANFIKEHGLTDPSIIGHSMGAKTAMVLALKSPDMVRDIIPVDNAPIDAALLSNFGTYVRGMKYVDLCRVKRQAEADKILQSYEPSLTIRHFLMGNLHRVKVPDDDPSPEAGKTILQFRIPLGTLGKALDVLGDFPYKDTNAVRFEKPALFVRGTKSHYVPDEALPIIGQFFPRFEAVDIEAGHWVISENPEAFRQAVVRFLTPRDD